MPTEANWRQSERSQQGFLEVLPGGGREGQKQVGGSPEIQRQKCLAAGQFKPHAWTHRDFHPCQHSHARAHAHLWVGVSGVLPIQNTHTHTSGGSLRE